MSQRLAALACTALIAMAAPALAQTPDAPVAPPQAVPAADPPKQVRAKPAHIGPPIQLHVAAKARDTRQDQDKPPVLQADAAPEIYQGIVQ